MGGGDVESQSGLEDGAPGGPGAPTPLSALEVCSTILSSFYDVAENYMIRMVAKTALQGVAGLTARDIKLVVDGGFNTVESVAYTYVQISFYKIRVGHYGGI